MIESRKNIVSIFVVYIVYVCLLTLGSYLFVVVNEAVGGICSTTTIITQ